MTRSILLVALALSASGCTTVQPWERDVLARPEMSLDANPLDAAIDEALGDFTARRKAAMDDAWY